MKPRPQVEGISRAGRDKWRMRIMVQGKRVQRTFPSEGDARVARAQIKGRAATASLGLPVSAVFSVPKLGKILDGYVNECEALGRSPAHLRSIADARELLVRWGGEDLDARMARADLVAFVSWARIHTESKGRRIHNTLVILKTAMRLADLPVPASPRFELPARVPKTYSREQLFRLLEQLPLGSVARTAIEIGLRTGARETEIRRIKAGDLDLERGTLILRRKRRGQEILPVSAGLSAVLKAYGISDDPDAPLLTIGALGTGPLLLCSLRRTLEAACTRAKVPNRTTIGWTRAQSATLAREEGMALQAVSATLGHMDVKTTLAHYDESGRLEVDRWASRVKAGAILDGVLDGKDVPLEPSKAIKKDTEKT